MVVQAYILIQTEVGRPRRWPRRSRRLRGQAAEDVTGPYDVIARVEAAGRRRARPAVMGEDPGRQGDHPHPHLHRRPRLSRAPARAGPRPVLMPSAGGARRRSRSRWWPRPPAPGSTSAPRPRRPTRPAPSVMARLPDRLAGGLDRRTATGVATAAWGDPPVVLRCGVPPPGPTGAPCLRVADVDWVAGDVPDWTFTPTGARRASGAGPPPGRSPTYGRVPRRSRWRRPPPSTRRGSDPVAGARPRSPSCRVQRGPLVRGRCRRRAAQRRPVGRASASRSSRSTSVG